MHDITNFPDIYAKGTTKESQFDEISLGLDSVQLVSDVLASQFRRPLTSKCMRSTLVLSVSNELWLGRTKRDLDKFILHILLNASSGSILTNTKLVIEVAPNEFEFIQEK
jgi:hypothetical protein